MRHRTSAPKVRQDMPDVRTAVDSLQRGLEILRNFRVGDNSLSIGDLSARTGLPRATVARLINTLAAHRFVCPIPGTDRYRADVACQSVGRALLSNHPLVLAGQARLRGFAERFGVDLIIAVRERLDMICIAHRGGALAETAPGRGQEIAHDTQIATGALLPIATTAVGRAWLWSQPSHVQGEIVQHIRSDASMPGGGGVMPQVYRAFQELEERGFCTQSGEGPRAGSSAGSIAAPIVVAGQTGGALACLAEPGQGDVATLADTLGSELVALAQQIGRGASNP
ncbi:IclR family transcriptional regulator [Paraburkholderia sp. DGU8]|uniref:IclR family transcriptional regulator n=1 Tax=Paraburkholderia sp. DGU8 TaxID=3161997 RepID=UPI0034662F9B